MGKKKKILVADDDASILDVMTIMLQEMGGYDVDTTTKGETLLEMTTYPDLIVLDLWMSGINGSEICQRLKADEKTRQIPIIIFSANRDIRQISESVGADDYLAKPFQMKDLLEKVHRLVG